jgi:hypothetical protein
MSERWSEATLKRGGQRLIPSELRKQLAIDKQKEENKKLKYHELQRIKKRYNTWDLSDNIRWGFELSDYVESKQPKKLTALHKRIVATIRRMNKENKYPTTGELVELYCPSEDYKGLERRFAGILQSMEYRGILDCRIWNDQHIWRVP